jgi:hypothetical protein
MRCYRRISKAASPVARAVDSAVPGSASAVVSYPGRLQLDYPSRRVVHLRYCQAEPVPKASQPFTAGPGDRLLQLPPVDEVGWVRGAPRHPGRGWSGPLAWGWAISWLLGVHRDLLRAWPACAGCLAGFGSWRAQRWSAPGSLAARGSTTRDGPREHSHSSICPARACRCRPRQAWVGLKWVRRVRQALAARAPTRGRFPWPAGAGGVAGVIGSA